MLIMLEMNSKALSLSFFLLMSSNLFAMKCPSIAGKFKDSLTKIASLPLKGPRNRPYIDDTTVVELLSQYNLSDDMIEKILLIRYFDYGLKQRLKIQKKRLQELELSADIMAFIIKGDILYPSSHYIKRLTTKPPMNLAVLREGSLFSLKHKNGFLVNKTFVKRDGRTIFYKPFASSREGTLKEIDVSEVYQPIIANTQILYPYKEGFKLGYIEEISESDVLIREIPFNDRHFTLGNFLSFNGLKTSLPTTREKAYLLKIKARKKIKGVKNDDFLYTSSQTHEDLKALLQMAANTLGSSPSFFKIARETLMEKVREELRKQGVHTTLIKLKYGSSIIIVDGIDEKGSPLFKRYLQQSNRMNVAFIIDPNLLRYKVDGFYRDHFKSHSVDRTIELLHGTKPAVFSHEGRHSWGSALRQNSISHPFHHRFRVRKNAQKGLYGIDFSIKRLDYDELLTLEEIYTYIKDLWGELKNGIPIDVKAFKGEVILLRNILEISSNFFKELSDQVITPLEKNIYETYDLTLSRKEYVSIALKDDVMLDFYINSKRLRAFIEYNPIKVLEVLTPSEWQAFNLKVKNLQDSSEKSLARIWQEKGLKINEGLLREERYGKFTPNQQKIVLRRKLFNEIRQKVINEELIPYLRAESDNTISALRSLSSQMNNVIRAYHGRNNVDTLQAWKPVKKELFQLVLLMNKYHFPGLSQDKVK